MEVAVPEPFAKERSLRPDGIGGLETQPQPDHGGFHLQSLDRTARKAEKNRLIETRLGQGEATPLASAVGEGDQPMHRRDPASRRRDAPGKRSNEAPQQEKERLAIVHLVFKIVLLLEELFQLG